MTVQTETPVRQVPADTFAARIMLARMHAGNLTYSQAAERCGLSRENWANWERGKRPRDMGDAVRRISDGLGVDREWLMWGGPLSETNRCCIQITNMATTPPPTGQRPIGRSTPDLVRPPHMTRLNIQPPTGDDTTSIRRPVRLSNPLIG